ncbi:MAG: Gfo/Idh/MocA family oxidoreductase [Ruminococcaceae bacterium]|nr:Gfo/Idh/MocA family oxidoreductase [Oscillospiraceae bacterium]
MKKLKIGVMGARRGMSMIRVLLHHPDAELVAVCDKYEPFLDNVRSEADKAGISIVTYNNFDDFIEHDMDAVILANYAHEHAPFAVRCLKAGKHVLSEVLPCGTIAQGVELIEAVEESGLVYAYAENYCYMQHNFEMWYRIKNGDIGEISYAEGEYVHDCTSIWPSITYGEPDHWRNNMHANFYCTHSLGPMLMSIGKRPISVVGFEMPEFGRGGNVPWHGAGAGLEMVTLENGCVCRSLHGHLRREHERNYNYMFYGDFGMMESSRFKDTPLLNVYREGDKFCAGTWEKYDPQPRIKLNMDVSQAGHMGSDYYATHFFIEKILGRPDGAEWSIDVYQAVEMGICGLLAHRSVLNGNRPERVPDFRIKAERDAYRNDNDTTIPGVENGHIVPISSIPSVRPMDEQYFTYHRQLWDEKKNFTEYPY